MENWFFETKLGYFISIISISIISEILITNVFTTIKFLPIFIGSVCVAVYYTLTNKNKRWY